LIVSKYIDDIFFVWKSDCISKQLTHLNYTSENYSVSWYTAM